MNEYINNRGKEFYLANINKDIKELIHLLDLENVLKIKKLDENISLMAA